jgi:hypothetical protein
MNIKKLALIPFILAMGFTTVSNAMVKAGDQNDDSCVPKLIDGVQVIVCDNTGSSGGSGGEPSPEPSPEPEREPIQTGHGQLGNPHLPLDEHHTWTVIAERCAAGTYAYNDTWCSQARRYFSGPGVP